VGSGMVISLGYRLAPRHRLRRRSAVGTWLLTRFIAGFLAIGAQMCTVSLLALLRHPAAATVSWDGPAGSADHRPSSAAADRGVVSMAPSSHRRLVCAASPSRCLPSAASSCARPRTASALDVARTPPHA